jgi:hypothetical protein
MTPAPSRWCYCLLIVSVSLSYFMPITTAHFVCSASESTFTTTCSSWRERPCCYPGIRNIEHCHGFMSFRTVLLRLSRAADCWSQVIGPEFLLDGRMSRCQGTLNGRTLDTMARQVGCRWVLAYNGFLEFITLSFLARIPHCIFIHYIP